MREMKIVISDQKSGKSYTGELPKDSEPKLIGMKVGEQMEGALADAEGYVLKITGGSDLSGIPMRPDVSGPRRASLLLSAGPGFNPTKKGERMKKTVRGNVITDEIVQLNTIVVQAGSKPLEELFPPTKKEEKKERK
ncbi:30S ribosomal protein S6e [Candidatus Micrarchaeota archaeon]|nr:30S ribosomal protein S6e [Candidatus Micrarchaeota archaeon]